MAIRSFARNSLKGLASLLVGGSLAYAQDVYITSINHDATKERVTLTYTPLPTNTTWRVEYTDNLVHGSWKSYAYALQSGTTNKVVLSTGGDPIRFFRLKQQ
jgi:hypothetical protein